MPAPKKGPRLGGGAAHERLMLSNLATALFEHGRITTTETRARLLRPVAEKLITKAKRGDLHNRREVLKTVRDKSVVHTLFTEIAPTFAERPGGYTRITKIGPRKGDNAPMAVIELVTEAYSPKAASTKKTQAAAPTPVAADPRDPEDRLLRFLDAGSVSLLVPRDSSGVLAARGTVAGTRAVVFCTDATVMGGAMGVDGCRHIVDAIDTALRERVPVVGIWHSGGARLAEGVTALHAVGEVFAAMVRS